MKCIICGFEGSGKKFSNHLQKEHKINSKDYTLKFLYKNYNGCLNCGKETRYVAFTFKKYCKDCAKLGMKEGGSKGGKAKAWNKGKTKETDSRIKGFKGEDNPFWGKSHSEEVKNRISMTKRLGGNPHLYTFTKPKQSQVSRAIPLSYTFQSKCLSLL